MSEGTNKPTRRLARYTVIFERELGDEDGQNDYGVTDEASAVQQLRKELQEACDECGIAGQFNIVKREEVAIEPGAPPCSQRPRGAVFTAKQVERLLAALQDAGDTAARVAAHFHDEGGAPSEDLRRVARECDACGIALLGAMAPVATNGAVDLNSSAFDTIEDGLTPEQ